MNEHPVDRDLETARMVGSWLERTADKLPDNPTGRERLLDRVERTSQRSARWLPPVYPGGLGRVVSAARLAAAAGVVIILAGLLLMALLPRDEVLVVDPAGETVSPSPTTEVPVRSAYVTGRYIDGRRSGDEVSHWDGDIYHRAEPEVAREIEWSDPRLPREMRHWIDWEEYLLDPEAPSQRGGVKSGVVQLRDEQGSWDGVIEGYFPRDYRWETEWFTLTGSGAYDGLYAVIVASHWYDTDTFEFHSEFEGLIAEGEPPPARPISPTTHEP